MAGWSRSAARHWAAGTAASGQSDGLCIRPILADVRGCGGDSGSSIALENSIACLENALPGLRAKPVAWNGPTLSAPRPAAPHLRLRAFERTRLQAPMRRSRAIRAGNRGILIPL